MKYLKIAAICALCVVLLMVFIPKSGPSLPPGLTLAQSNQNNFGGANSTQTFSGSQPQITLGANGGNAGQWALAGSTSGTATCTAPAVAGTRTNPVVCSNIFQLPNGAAGAASFSVNTDGSGMFYDAGTNTIQWGLGVNARARLGASAGAGLELFANESYAWNVAVVGSGFSTTDTMLSRFAAGVVSVDTTATGNAAGLLRTGNKVFVTTDFTDANSAALQAITGLTYALGTAVQNFSFHCSLMYSQATAAAGDQFGVGVITTAPTNVNVAGLAYTSTGAASVAATGTLNALASTTPTAVVTFQPAVNATVYNATLDGTVETAGTTASTFNIYVLNGTAANVIVIKRGSYCSLF